MIQYKRNNSNPVREPEIKQFHGTINQFQADYDVFITNSRFAYKVRKATREGASIILLDGNDLVRLVIKCELFIPSVTTYVLDGFYLRD